LYIAIVALTMLVLPVLSIGADAATHPAAPLMLLVGKWFVFWGVGVRLAMAGLRQFLQPAFTARQIFNMQSDEALILVRELGVANFGTGVVGLLSLVAPSFVMPVAISAGIFYGVAGVRHGLHPGRSRNETIAMVSDLGIALVLIAVVASMALGIGR
jgi:hypothetical protein